MIPILFAQAAPSTQFGIGIWVPVISALLASALTGAISYALASLRQRHEERVEKRMFLIGKLEETHRVTRSLLRFFGTNFAQLSIAVAAPNKPEFVQQLGSSGQYDTDATTDRLSMLVDFYFPQLRPQLGLVAKAQEEYSKTMTEIIQVLASANYTLRRPMLDRLQAAHAEIQKAFRALQENLSAVARKVL